MDVFNTNLTDTALTSTSVEQTVSGSDSDAAKEQFAKDFESILIGKLLDEMKNTIGQWGMEQDGTAEQVQGIFWMNLSQELGSQGGLGVWKDIYQSLGGSSSETETPLLDRTL